MPFSAMINPIFGMVGTGLSAYFSYKQQQEANAMAQRQLQLQERAMRDQRDFQMLSLGQASDQQRMIQAENDYRRNLEQSNRSQLLGERQFAIGEYRQNQNQLKQEREYMIDRQIQADRLAADQRAQAITEYMRNRDLQADERRQALDALREAKAIASGERDDDIRRMAEYKAKLQEERDYATGKYDEMDRRLVGERQTEMDRRRGIEDRIGGLQRALESTRTQLGDLPTLRKFTEEDISNEENKRSALYMSNADRAADRVASINEANLIRSGIDAGTAGAKKRGEITEQISSLYDNARMKAREEALAYINGVQGVLNLGFDKDLGRRQYALGETANVAGAGIDQLMQMPGLPSAANFNYANAPSAAFDRAVVSANNYQSPLQVNSAVYEGFGNIPIGMAGTLNLPSAAGNGWNNLPSGVMAPYEQQFGNPQDYFNTAVGIGDNMLNTRNNNAQFYQTAAGNAGYNFGRALQSGISSLGSLANAGYDWWNQPSYSPPGPTATFGGPK